MNNIKRVFWVLVTLSIVFSLFYVENKNEKKESSVVGIELSLKEAIKLGLDRAKKWNVNAYVAFITSVDEDMGGTMGGTGKRYNWTMSFEDSSTDQQLIVMISKGKIIESYEGRGPSFGEIKLDDIKFDSPDLLKIAKEKYDLQKGRDWATGYHFTIDGEKGKPTVSILGNDRDSLFTRITFDAKNGEIVRASHKVPVGGGLIKARLGSGESVTSKKGMAIKGISANYKQVAIWGDLKPRVFNFSVQPFLGYSQNGGEIWRDINMNKDILNAWVNLDNELYAATELGIWRIETSDNKMNRILTTENKVEKINYSTNNNIVMLSNNYIYKTVDNGENWNAIIQPGTEEIISLQITDGGTVILLTNSGEIFQGNGDEWINFKLSQGIKTPSYMELMGNNLFLLSDYTLWVQNLNEGGWNKVQTKYEFNTLIKKGNNLFGISEDGVVYLIKLGGYANEWKVERLFEVKEGIIADLELTQDDLFIATIPDYHWESMN
ncbi:WD40/YVTN/BNR-like repeat-containing protein [Viridibacillus sp. NPDC093762]|uniref:WD40/YVTN/BNR-like repeat-containing protein n=1 Tax=Viridibacillus sp. NPDC093762 TaxID=3390720 RepID=UPI003D081710